MVSKLRSSHTSDAATTEKTNEEFEKNSNESFSFQILRREKQPLGYGKPDKSVLPLQNYKNTELLENEEAPASLFTPAASGNHASSASMTTFPGSSHSLKTSQEIEKNTSSPGRSNRRKKNEYEMLTEYSSPIRSSWYDTRSASPAPDSHKMLHEDAENPMLDHSSLSITTSARAPRVTRRIARMLDTGLLDTPPCSTSSIRLDYNSKPISSSVYVEAHLPVSSSSRQQDSNEKTTSLYDRAIMRSESNSRSPRKVSLRNYQTQYTEDAQPNMSRVPKSPAVSLAKITASKYNLDLDTLVQDVTEDTKTFDFWEHFSFLNHFFDSLIANNQLNRIYNDSFQYYQRLKRTFRDIGLYIFSVAKAVKSVFIYCLFLAIFLYATWIFSHSFLAKSSKPAADISNFTITKDALDIFMTQNNHQLIQDIAATTDKKILALKKDFESFLHTQVRQRHDLDEKIDEFKTQIYSRISDLRVDLDSSQSKTSAEIDSQLKKLLQNLPRQTEPSSGDFQSQWMSEIVSIKGSIENFRVQLDEALSSSRSFSKKTEVFSANEKIVLQRISAVEKSLDTFSETIAKLSKYSVSNTPSNSHNVSFDKDYALYSDGAKVISELTTETYGPGSFLQSLFYFTPRGKPPFFALIQDVSLGNCWSFAGSKGTLTIELSSSVVPRKVAVEHVPFDIARNPSSAPKDMELYAIEDLNLPDSSAVLMSKFTFDVEQGLNLQTVPIQNPPTRPIKYVQLRIISNNGHPKYTCLYKLKVYA